MVIVGLADLSNDFNQFDGRSGEIRTPDPLVPNQMRYQTALHSAEAMAGEYTVHPQSATGKFIFVEPIVSIIENSCNAVGP